MECRELMVQPAYTVKPSAPVEAAACLMRDLSIGFLPVCDNAGRLLGVLTDRDIAVRVCAEGLSPALTSVGQVMTREVVSCRASDDLQRAEDLMMQRGTSRIAVIDEEERLSGVLSIADIACSLDSGATRTLRAVAGRDAHAGGEGHVHS